MDDAIIQIMAKAMKFANLSDPFPKPGVTRLKAAVPDFNSRHFAEVAIRALEAAGYEIMKKGT
jgi:hypothetical protein